VVKFTSVTDADMEREGHLLFMKNLQKILEFGKDV
jgi:hypothetical protein